MAALYATPPGSLRSLGSTGKMTCLRLCILIFAVLTLNSQVAWAQQCSDTTFVQRVYQDLLLRQPSASEVTFYVPAVQSNGRQAVALSLVASQEYALDLISGSPTVVAGWYQNFLGRNPTPAEAQFTLNQEPTSDGSIIAVLLSSAEYRTRAITVNPAISDDSLKLVNQMFKDLLSRNASSGELAFFGAALSSGGTAAQVATAILSSNEYFSGVIGRAYLRMLRRPATQSEINSFLSPLKSDARPDEDLLAILAGSSEYCSSTVQPPPAFQLQAPATTFPALNSVTIPSNLSLLPAVQFGPLEASSNAAILGLQVVVSSDEARIASLNAEVSRLNDQITLLNSLLVNESLTITDLTNTLFGAPPTLEAAQAAQKDAQDKVAQALASAGTGSALVQNAQANLTQGDAALAAGDFSTAVKRYRLAFLLAGNALK